MLFQTQYHAAFYCKIESNSYFMLFQTGDECHCGNNYNYDRHTHNQQLTCDETCAGNVAETCGGDWRLQIYSGTNMIGVQMC